MCIYEENGWRLCGCLLDLCLLPLVCTTGLVLNIACLLVFFSNSHHPLVPVWFELFESQILGIQALIVLSVSDCLQLLFSFFVLFLPALHDFTGAPPHGILGQLAYLATGLLSPLLLTFNCASIWTICYISVQRHKAILRPLTNMHSPQKPFKPLIFICILALLFNICKWMEFRWFYIEVDTNSTEPYQFLAHEQSELALNEHYRRILDNILYPVMVYLIPLLLLSVLNFRILTNISSRRIAFDHKSRLAQERRSVTLLISIVTMFFLCHTGGLAIRFIDESKFTNIELYVLLKDVINLLFNISSLANPMLYFLFTRQFRDLRTILHSHFASPASRSESYVNNPQVKLSTSSNNIRPHFYRSPCSSGRLLY